MKRYSTILALLLGILPLHAATVQPVLLPLPTQVSYAKGQFSIPARLAWHTNVACAAEREALAGAVTALAPDAQPATAADAPLALLLTADTTALPSPESYTVRVEQQRVTVSARTAAGLYYGLQTLIQLRADGSALPLATIADTPRYGQRGLMLDVSRHFFSKDFIKKQIRAMAALKLNRLHLHLTDAAGWRIEIKKYPRLTQIGAWRPAQNWKIWWTQMGRRYSEEGAPDAAGGYYTQADIRELVAYARAHFVTIVPELEMPAHSEETLVAYPELSCTGQPYASSDFCPGNERVYAFWRDVLTEVAALFPGTEIHIGGDEAAKTAWHTCPRCQAAMRRHHLPDVNALQSWFVQRISDIALGIGRHITGWDDLMAGGAPTGSTVQIWGGIDKARQAIADGHSVILSCGKYLYLDAYQDSPLSQPEAIGGYLPLEDVYRLGSVLDTISLGDASRIRGIEACLWTEYVPTEQHLEEMVYPRLLAVSEVAWGTHASPALFRQRAEAYSRRLMAAGYTPFRLDRETGQRPESLRPARALSVGRPVTYHAPYHASYPAQGAATLTDGQRGGWTYGDGRWQGFISQQRLDVTIDLGRPMAIRSVAADFLHVAGAEVYAPATTEILVSTDGQTYTPLWRSDDAVDTLKPYDIQHREWQGKSRARYVRVRAGAGERGGWIFTDEILVR